MADLSPGNSLLLVIDIQEKFRGVVRDFEGIILKVSKLIRAFNILKIPVLVTEQYPHGLGETVKELKEVLKEYKKIEKVSFDCFNDSKFVESIVKYVKKDVV
ncbi:MAG: isochorismatase family protein, partial [Deltaproteobacteria bacterium]|nr:isochorismatase family protein [Deltaproteobacteria bacterium]